jgi:hypothetical protein
VHVKLDITGAKNAVLYSLLTVHILNENNYDTFYFHTNDNFVYPSIYQIKKIILIIRSFNVPFSCTNYVNSVEINNLAKQLYTCDRVTVLLDRVTVLLDRVTVLLDLVAVLLDLVTVL